jgi:hypothetical protein
MDQAMASGSRSMCTSELRQDFIRRNSRSSEQSIEQKRADAEKIKQPAFKRRTAPLKQGAGTLLSGSRSLQREQPFLPLKPPAISCKLPIPSNDSMTRDGHRIDEFAIIATITAQHGLPRMGWID